MKEEILRRLDRIKDDTLFIENALANYGKPAKKGKEVEEALRSGLDVKQVAKKCKVSKVYVYKVYNRINKNRDKIKIAVLQD